MLPKTAKDTKDSQSRLDFFLMNNGNVCRCSNCNRLGHTDDTCFQLGGKMEGRREEYLANRGTKVQAHLTNTEDTPQTEITIDPSDELVLTQEFAAMSLNTMNDIDFASYSSLQSVTSTLEGNSTPVAFASLHEQFNMALDSACTNHIIRDQNLFQTYDVSSTVPVKTANCGFLTTLAIGDVKFRIVIKGTPIIWTLKNCLHAQMYQST